MHIYIAGDNIHRKKHFLPGFLSCSAKFCLHMAGLSKPTLRDANVCLSFVSQVAAYSTA